MGYNGRCTSSKPRRSNAFKGYKSGSSLFFKSVNFASTGKTYIRKPIMNKASSPQNSGCMFTITLFLIISSSLIFFFF